jgi:uncharacterized protein (DUF2384 family)
VASVETTTIRVRRDTHERLQKEAKLAGKSVTQVLEEATELFEEQRMLDSFVRSYEKYGGEIREEMKDWLEMPSDGLPDDDWSDVVPDGDEGP